MKTLGKIKLNQFTKKELDRRKLHALKGGCTCMQDCTCYVYGGLGIDTSTDAGWRPTYAY